MNLDDYSTETLINYLKNDRGVNLKFNQITKNISLKPYFAEVIQNEESIKEWKGHYGLTEDGRITFCTPGGYRIVSSTFLKINSNGVIMKCGGFRSDTSIKVDPENCNKIVIE